MFIIFEICDQFHSYKNKFDCQIFSNKRLKYSLILLVRQLKNLTLILIIE